MSRKRTVSYVTVIWITILHEEYEEHEGAERQEKYASPTYSLLFSSDCMRNKV
ncbi:MAG: hypothetical protein LBM95_00285 [Lactobacillales bacterium]|nr:hypothetical protein [Lactobacillales bacterium]